MTEYTGVNETATISSGSPVVGLRAGAIANRQIAIYDKRAEVIQQNNVGWLPIWNAALAAVGNPPHDLTDRDSSQVWRFEMRLGSKQLSNRFEMRNWQDIRDMIGDANRTHWSVRCLSRQFEDVIGNDRLHNCAGVLPNDVIHATQTAKMRELDAHLLGLFVTRAAISDDSAAVTVPNAASAAAVAVASSLAIPNFM